MSPFDEVIDRRGTNALKWDAGPSMLAPDELAADPLPMWVADTDFRAPQAVLDALRDRVEHGVFGYACEDPPAGYLDAVVGWQQRRHGWTVERDGVMPTTGVLTSLRAIVQAFSAPGESVLIQPPVYGRFHRDIELNGRHLATAPLVRTDDGYRFDADVFESAFRPDTRLFVLSNPHNPTGNVWSADELRTMGEVCASRDVLVVADEIHQDLVLDPDLRHVPFASLGPGFAARSITCVAPSKTFNLPGLQSAVVIIPDERLRATFRRQYDRNLVTLVNVLGLAATEAAYTHGDGYVDELVAYVRGNHERFAAAVHAATTRVRVLPAGSLYLAWMDCRDLGMAPDELDRFMRLRARLWLAGGTNFGPEGAGYLRVNLGCPRATVDEAADRLVAALATA